MSTMGANQSNICSAKIIADSICNGTRITTMEVVFPRFVLAEFNTHRVFSRNSASSRARPVGVVLEDLRQHPFVPEHWMKAHKGMQGSDYFNTDNHPDNPEYETVQKLREAWLAGRDAAINTATRLDKLGLTKQLINRVLEPYLLHTVLVTSTDYANFFALRANPSAEIHIREAAHLMLQEYNNSRPKLLQPGQWHIPFGDFMSHERICEVLEKQGEKITEDNILSMKIKIASARAARLSYSNFGEESKYNYENDIILHDRLVREGHWSPLEHCARAMCEKELSLSEYSGNFKHWIQYRKMFPNENRTDDRIDEFKPDVGPVNVTRDNNTNVTRDNNTNVTRDNNTISTSTSNNITGEAVDIAVLSADIIPEIPKSAKRMSAEVAKVFGDIVNT